MSDDHNTSFELELRDPEILESFLSYLAIFVVILRQHHLLIWYKILVTSSKLICPYVNKKRRAIMILWGRQKIRIVSNSFGTEEEDTEYLVLKSSEHKHLCHILIHSFLRLYIPRATIGAPAECHLC